MANDTITTIVGNLVAAPELRFQPSGAAVASFTVASTPRSFDKNANEWRDGETLFMRCSIWRDAAENVAESLTKGMRVIVQGRLVQRSFETRDGDKRTPFEPALRVGLRAYRAALARGVLLRPLGDVLYWMPPYCIDDAQLQLLAETTLAAIEEATA